MPDPIETRYSPLVPPDMQDEIFWKALWNTVYYTGLRVPFSLLFSLIVALLMNLKIRGILWWRVVYFVPAISSSVALSLVQLRFSRWVHYDNTVDIFYKPLINKDLRKSMLKIVTF